MPRASRAKISHNGKINYGDFNISENADDNIAMMKEIFSGDDTLICRAVESRDGVLRCAAVMFDGMVNSQLVNMHVIKPVVSYEGGKLKGFAGVSMDEIEERLIGCNELKRSSDVGELVEAVMYGDTLLFADGLREALIIGSKGFVLRSVSEPDNEKGLRGPREGFTESILVNISMLRRKLQTSELKMKYTKLGTRTGTRICLCYLDSLADKAMLADLEQRLSEIDADGIFCTNYIEEQICDSRFSPFRTVGYTEKPDILAANILEGRVAVFVDGSPSVLTVPYLFVENFQSPDDYYVNYLLAAAGRLVRFLAFFLTISVPALYIAVLNFHQEMIPDALMASLASAASNTPFPGVVECLGMLVVFELLRETGIRSSSKIGQAIGIVGGLVVGQAAIEAKLVGSPTVIIIALAGITGILNSKIGAACFLIRLAALLLTACVGIFGYFFVMVFLCVHIFSLKSMGYDYVTGIGSSGGGSWQDALIRAPFWNMRKRPVFARDRVRSGN